jgi:NADPH-dependent 2,4-dienoyl-CoA reductase/sulfur reductase-like enzyme
MHQPKKIIVIGGNAAGPSAAAKAKRVNPDIEVLLFEAGEFISTGTCELPYLFSGEIKDYSEIVFFTPESFLKEKGVEVLNNHLVKGINVKYKEISVINKKTNSLFEFEYDKLILTTGSKPNEIYDLPFTIENVFSFKSVHDYLKIKNFASTNDINNILVIGSGYIGLEVADAFNKIGLKVTILEKELHPMPNGDEEVQLLIHDILTKNGISFLSSDEQTRYIIKNNRLNQLKWNGRFIDFDLVIVAAGVTPNNYLAEEAGLKLGFSSGLIVDSRLKTSNPDIYAAGDNIEIRNFISRQNDYIPLATHAHSYGHLAGENAAGGNKIAEPVILNSAFQLCEKFIAQVGLSEKQAKEHSVNSMFVTAVTNNKVKVMPDSGKVFGKIIFDKYTQQILGASFVGTEEVSGYADIISTMIFNKIPVKNLANVNFNYTPPLSPFVNLLSVLGRKIKEIN